MPDELRDEDLADFVSIGQAARLVPSPKTGRRTHTSTIRRWVRQGKLEGRKRGRWLFVRRSHLLAMLQPVPVTPPKPPASRADGTAEAWALEVLRRRGAV